MREHRAVTPREVRALDDEGKTFEAVVVRYGVVDDYNTIFEAGCFADSLQERMPRITWHHDWTDVIGRWTDYTDTDTELTLRGEFDDFDAVPRARQASAQLRSGTIDQFSVGFMRQKVFEDDDARTHFTKAKLDEVALVLVGAVPGTKLLAVRSAAGVRQVPETAVLDLARKVKEGLVPLDEAKIALDLLTVDAPPPPKPDDEDENGDEPDAALAAAEAEADAALASLNDV